MGKTLDGAEKIQSDSRWRKVCVACVAGGNMALDGVRWSKVRAACVAWAKMPLDGVIMDDSRWSELIGLHNCSPSAVKPT